MCTYSDTRARNYLRNKSHVSLRNARRKSLWIIAMKRPRAKRRRRFHRVIFIHFIIVWFENLFWSIFSKNINLPFFPINRIHIVCNCFSNIFVVECDFLLIEFYPFVSSNLKIFFSKIPTEKTRLFSAILLQLKKNRFAQLSRLVTNLKRFFLRV